MPIMYNVINFDHNNNGEVTSTTLAEDTSVLHHLNDHVLRAPYRRSTYVAA